MLDLILGGIKERYRKLIKKNDVDHIIGNIYLGSYYDNAKEDFDIVIDCRVFEEGDAPDDLLYASLLRKIFYSGNKKVLVCCKYGRGRSPTVVIGYLVEYRYFSTLENAYKFVKCKRDVIYLTKKQKQFLIRKYGGSI